MQAVIESDSVREQKLRQLIEEYEIGLLRVCYMLLHDAELAEDAVQKTYLKAYLAMDKFRGESSEKTWLTRIAVNTCKDMRRSAWMRHMDRNMTPEMLPEASLPFDERDEELILSVMALPLKLREVILLRYYQDMSIKEIAETLGIAASSVSNRLKRAIKKLQIMMERGHFHG